MDLCQVPSVKENLSRKRCRDCTADRVLLSTHMVDHWDKIKYLQDTEMMDEVDQEEPEIQVGVKIKQQILIPEISLTIKYHSVIIKGFRADTPLDNICDILNQEDFKKDFDVSNEKTGCLTLENLKPE